MPTYNYKCSNCNHEFEKFLKISEMNIPLEQPCPECNTENFISKIISAVKTSYLCPDQTGKVKPPQEWTDFLNKLKKNSKGCSDFNTFR